MRVADLASRRSISMKEMDRSYMNEEAQGQKLLQSATQKENH